MAAPYMCGSSMGMVFCPPNFASNSGTGFSLLFQSWVISSRGAYALACVGVFFMGALRQCLSCLRTHFPQLAARLVHLATPPAPNAEAMLQPPPAGSSPSARSLTLLACDSILLGAGLFLAYLNMLVAMAYDFGLLSSLVAGEAAAHFALAALGLSSAEHAAGAAEQPCC